MNVKLRNVLIGAFLFFLVVIFFSVTGWHQKIRDYITANSRPLTFLAVCVIGGLLIYYFFFYLKRQKADTMMEEAWAFVGDWWQNKMNVVGEELKPEDTIMKEGFFDSKQGTFERMFGFNTIKRNSSQRMVVIVGTSPMRIALVVNQYGIGELDDPFMWFNKSMPGPIPFFDDKAPQPMQYGQDQYSQRGGGQDRQGRKWIGEAQRGNRPPPQNSEEEG